MAAGVVRMSAWWHGSHGFCGEKHAARQASCDRPLVRGWLPGRRLGGAVS
jgi:hypothetical protein